MKIRYAKKIQFHPKNIYCTSTQNEKVSKSVRDGKLTS